MAISTNYPMGFQVQPDIQTYPVGSGMIQTQPLTQSDSWAGASQAGGQSEFSIGPDGTRTQSWNRQGPDGAYSGYSISHSPDGTVASSSYRNNADGSWQRTDTTCRNGQEERNTWRGGPGGQLQSYSSMRNGQDGRTDVNLTTFDTNGRPTDYSFHRSGKARHHHHHHPEESLPIRNGYQMQPTLPGQEAPPIRG